MSVEKDWKGWVIMGEIDIEKYMERMIDAVNNGDTEAAHGDADGILCELLSELGYGELIGLYSKVDKWYA